MHIFYVNRVHLGLSDQVVPSGVACYLSGLVHHTVTMLKHKSNGQQSQGGPGRQRKHSPLPSSRNRSPARNPERPEESGRLPVTSARPGRARPVLHGPSLGHYRAGCGTGFTILRLGRARQPGHQLCTGPGRLGSTPRSAARRRASDALSQLRRWGICDGARYAHGRTPAAGPRLPPRSAGAAACHQGKLNPHPESHFIYFQECESKRIQRLPLLVSCRGSNPPAN